MGHFSEGYLQENVYKPNVPYYFKTSTFYANSNNGTLIYLSVVVLALILFCKTLTVFSDVIQIVFIVTIVVAIILVIILVRINTRALSLDYFTSKCSNIIFCRYSTVLNEQFKNVDVNLQWLHFKNNVIILSFYFIAGFCAYLGHIAILYVLFHLLLGHMGPIVYRRIHRFQRILLDAVRNYQYIK